MAHPPSKVSFTIRRPSPVSRTASDPDVHAPPLPIPRHIAPSRSSSSSPAPKRTCSDRDDDDAAEPDSDAESDGAGDELVTGFDRFGVQRAQEKKPPRGPLTIPAQADRDWRAVARKRRAAAYVPPSAAAQTGADGSVGGLGTRGSINSGPQLSGIQLRKKVKVEEDADPAAMDTAAEDDPKDDGVPKDDPEDDDARALRALLAGSSSSADAPLAAIPLRPSEDAALKEDVAAFPEQATLADYARVPVEQFGAALLRGMGWDPHAAPTAGARGGKGRGKGGHVEPWVPAARPALLGIGAKEQEVLDDGSAKKKAVRPEKRYVPLVKVDRGGERGGEKERERGGERDRERDRERGGEREREKRREGDKDRDRDYRDRERDGRRDRDRDYRDRDRERYRDDRDRDSRGSSRRR